MTGHHANSTRGDEGHSRTSLPVRIELLAWVALGMGVVAVGVWAALESRGERPTASLLVAWGIASVLAVAGVVLGGRLNRVGALPGWATVFIVITSAVAQAPLAWAPPALSDDIYRYVHDGRVLAAGVNPYRHAPADPALDAIAGPERDRVNHPEVRTIYPPLAEAVFATVVILGGGTTGLKVLMAACGLVLTVLVGRALPSSRRHWVAAVGWHPLLLFECAGSGHLDVLAVVVVAGSCALLAAAPRLSRSAWLAASLLLAGALVKLLPGVMAAALERRLGLARSAVVVALALLVSGWMLVSAPDEKSTGLATYAEHWDYNGSGYPLVRAAVEGVSLMGRLQAVVPEALLRWTGPQYTSRALLGAAFAGAVVVAWWGVRRREWDAWRACGWMGGAFVLLTPTLHPWYLLWVLPFAVVRQSVAWSWLCFACGIAYASAVAAGDGPWKELAWPRLVEYAPFVLLCFVDLRRRRAARVGGGPAVNSENGPSV